MRRPTARIAHLQSDIAAVCLTSGADQGEDAREQSSELRLLGRWDGRGLNEWSFELSSQLLTR
jgi:hypothetical protein